MVSGGGGGEAVREAMVAMVLSAWWRGGGFGRWWRGFDEFKGDAGVEGAGPIAWDSVGFAVVEVPFP